MVTPDESHRCCEDCGLTTRVAGRISSWRQQQRLMGSVMLTYGDVVDSTRPSGGRSLGWHPGRPGRRHPTKGGHGQCDLRFDVRSGPSSTNGPADTWVKPARVTWSASRRAGRLACRLCTWDIAPDLAPAHGLSPRAISREEGDPN